MEDDAARLIAAQRSLSRELISPENKPLATRRQNLSRRLGQVTAIDFTNGTCSILLNNTTFTGVRWYNTYGPRENDFVWVEFNGGTDPIVVGTESTALPPPSQSKWHLVGAAGEPAFQNLWVNYGAGWATAAFRRVGELVIVRGLIKSGTMAAVAFNLPVGFRPWEHLTFGNWADPGSPSGSIGGSLYVDSAGNVIPYVGGNTSHGLNLTFVAER